MEWIIASILISALNQGITSAMKRKGASLTKDAQKIIRSMYDKITNNQQAIDKLYQAYNRHDSELLNALYNGIGYGSRVKTIRDAREQLSDSYEQGKDKILENSKQAEKVIDTANQAINRANDMTVHGMKDAQQSISQLISGGLRGGR